MRVLPGFVFWHQWIGGEIAGQADFGQTGAEVIMQILGNARSLTLDLLLLAERLQFAPQPLLGSPTHDNANNQQ